MCAFQRIEVATGQSWLSARSDRQSGHAREHGLPLMSMKRGAVDEMVAKRPKICRNTAHAFLSAPLRPQR